MGCVFSREEYEDNPRIFRVWNVDGGGRTLQPGRIEVTDNQLLFHQGLKSSIVVRWPLTSLRRYGFDANLFSFECGRRCATGAGVYAFRCRHASQLFSTLQEAIVSSTLVDEDQPGVTPLSNGNVLPPRNLALDSAGYLEPITHSQPTTATRSTAATSPGSYVCIHGQEFTSGDWPSGQSSVANCCSLGTSSSSHHYVNSDVTSSCPSGLCFVHQYVNASVVADNTYENSSAMMTLSPCHLQGCPSVVDANTNYAKLDELLKQEQASAKRHKEQRYYVNVKADDTRTSTTLSIKASAGYVNLSSKTETCNGESGSEEVQVNYAVLDLEQTKATSENIVLTNGAIATSVPCLISGSVANSPSKSPEGYAQIDFDKTVALSNSANPCPAFNDDSIRKTRHNAIIPCSSMSA